MRVACLRVPDLPLVAWLRAEPELAGAALAISAGSGPRAEIVAVSPAAARLGVCARQSVAQARTLCADLALRACAPALERSAREALRDAALSFSPRTEAAPPGTGVHAAEAAVFLDASGITALFCSEAGFATALAARAASLGLPALVALAGSRAVALLAARARGEPGEVRVLAPGREAAWLAPLAVDLLDPSDALAETLTRFGIRRLGELARLPAKALATRLGPEAVRLAALARGEADPVPIEATRETTLEEALELEAPLERLEPLAFALRGLLARFVARLELRGLACGELELELGLASGGRDARRVGLAAPTLDPKTLLRLVCLALEAHPPHDAVETLRLATSGVPVRADQLDLFRTAGPAPALLGRTLAELEALCGAGRVGAPVHPDSHRADAFSLESFALTRGSTTATAKRVAEPVQALRALRPPVPAQVRTERGMPQWIQSAVACGLVLGCAGPWRTTGGWWSSEHFAHDHFDVRTSDGTVSRLRHDRIQRAWHVDGVYD
jgi:protein ImuB